MRKLKNKELQRINIDEFKSAKKTPITIVLDNVRSAFSTNDCMIRNHIHFRLPF